MIEVSGRLDISFSTKLIANKKKISYTLTVNFMCVSYDVLEGLKPERNQKINFLVNFSDINLFNIIIARKIKNIDNRS